MLGIIGAMDEEIDELKKRMSSSDSEVEYSEYAGMTFCRGMLNKEEVVMVRSGIGKVNAAVAAEILADIYKVSAIINTGIAGSLSAEINIGDIVLSVDAMEHDMDVTGLGFEKGIVPDQEKSIYSADPDLRRRAAEICARSIPEIKVFEGRVVSGDIFVSDNKKKEELSKEMGGLCVEMEGASIAHVCWLHKLPYLIIRSISDKADDSAHIDYADLKKIALKNSVKLINELTSTL